MLLLNVAVLIMLVPKIFGLPLQKVAIIGGGIGGASCAYFLSKAFQGNVSITVFERDAIGGRLASINVGGNDYEAGGSVIHPRNKYMGYFTQTLGLQRKEPIGSLWGIYNGENFVFKDSAWSIVTLAKLYWRYGWDVFRLNSMVSSLLDEFGKIYKLQDQGIAYTTVTSLLQSMSPKFPNMTQQTLRSYLKKNSFSDIFIEELAEAVMLVNYGQTTDINAFVGAVSLAGSESGLWNVQGGNKQVPSGLFNESNSEIVDADVTSISLLENDDLEIAYRKTDSNLVEREIFQSIVLAAPLIEGHTHLQFHNFSKTFDEFFKPYHQTVATFVQGKLKPSAFNSETVPDAILINNDSFMVNSIGQTIPVTGKSETDDKVYKIFSKRPLTKDQINLLFSDVKTIKVKDWMAYPHYETPENIPSFVLHPNLYYANSIELSASAMEMSAISGRNIALLIYNTWKNEIDLIHPQERIYKDEL